MFEVLFDNQRIREYLLVKKKLGVEIGEFGSIYCVPVPTFVV